MQRQSTCQEQAQELGARSHAEGGTRAGAGQASRQVQGQKAGARSCNTKIQCCFVQKRCCFVRSTAVVKDVTKGRIKPSRQVLTQDVTKVRKHGCKEGSQEDVEAAQGGPGEPVLECPQATFLVQQLCLKGFHYRSAVDLHSLGPSHVWFTAQIALIALSCTLLVPSASVSHV